MTTSEPTAKNLADLYDLPPLEWDAVRRRIEEPLTQAPGTGGPDHHTWWLATVDADGRPHVTGVGVEWMDGHAYFTGGPRSRKIRNIERDPRCAFGITMSGLDVSIEGRAVRVTDDAKLQQVAVLFGEWGPTVADGGFVHEFSAPSAGPPPWHVYEFTPDDVYALMGEEPGGAMRWTF